MVRASSRELTDEELSDLAMSVVEAEYAEGANKALELVNRINQPTSRDLLVKAKCHRLKSEWDAANFTLDSVPKMHQTGFWVLERCLAILQDREIRQLFGRRYLKSEVNEQSIERKAIASLKEVLEVATLGTYRPIYAIFYLWLEDIWYLENQLTIDATHKNIALLKRGLEIFPRYEPLRLKLAHRLEEAGRNEEAVEILNWALEADSPSGQMIVVAINFLLRFDKPDQALDFSRKGKS